MDGMNKKYEYIHEDISKLLSEFKGVFEWPQGLPPSCSYDHKIVLKKGTQPISTRPYPSITRKQTLRR